MSKNPWSFKIDYDKAIAEDMLVIAQCENAINMGLVVPKEWEGFGCSFAALIVFYPEQAAKLDLSPMQRANLAAYCEMENIPKDLPESDNYWEGKAICERLATIWRDPCLMTMDKLQTMLKAYKVSLSRHKRNQAKYSK